ncbi:hypothetical protein ACFV5M_22355 [Streptomyces albidoflavus]
MMLYARTRGLFTALATLIGTALAAWWFAEWLIDTPRFGASARVPVIAMAPLLAAAAIVGSLHSCSSEIEETAARWIWLYRAGHLAIATAIYAVVLGVTVTIDHAAFGTYAMVRNILGFTGMAALVSILIGARLAWLPVMIYGTTTYLVAPRELHSGLTAAWAWPIQQGSEPAAWWAAMSLFATGISAGSWLGPAQGLHRDR